MLQNMISCDHEYVIVRRVAGLIISHATGVSGSSDITQVPRRPYRLIRPWPLSLYPSSAFKQTCPLHPSPPRVLLFIFSCRHDGVSLCLSGEAQRGESFAEWPPCRSLLVAHVQKFPASFPALLPALVHRLLVLGTPSGVDHEPCWCYFGWEFQPFAKILFRVASQWWRWWSQTSSLRALWLPTPTSAY